jgi:hypothetical protein
VHVHDKTDTLTPPYEPDDQQALRHAIISNAESGRWIWSRADTQRYFLAGGGNDPEFEPRWQRRLDEARQPPRTSPLIGSTPVVAGSTTSFPVAAQHSEQTCPSETAWAPRRDHRPCLLLAELGHVIPRAPSSSAGESAASQVGSAIARPRRLAEPMSRAQADGVLTNYAGAR